MLLLAVVAVEAFAVLAQLERAVVLAITAGQTAGDINGFVWPENLLAHALP